MMTMIMDDSSSERSGWCADDLTVLSRSKAARLAREETNAFHRSLDSDSVPLAIGSPIQEDSEDESVEIALLRHQTVFDYDVRPAVLQRLVPCDTRPLGELVECRSGMDTDHGENAKYEHSLHTPVAGRFAHEASIAAAPRALDMYLRRERISVQPMAILQQGSGRVVDDTSLNAASWLF